MKGIVEHIPSVIYISSPLLSILSPKMVKSLSGKYTFTSRKVDR